MRINTGKGFFANVPVICLSILIALIFHSNTALAKGSYLTSFTTKYPATAVSKLNSCNVCHGSGGTSTWNPYGQAIRSTAGADITARITAVEGLDSDGDGFTNIAEITALTYPGDPADKPASTPPPGDTTPPSVSSTSPANNQSGVAVSTVVTATFSEAVNAATVTTASFTLKSGLNAVAGTVSLNGSTARFTPSAPLANGTSYTATLTNAIKDTAGNGLAANYSWTFTTGLAADTTPPGVSTIDPAANQSSVPTNSTVTVTFSEAVNPATVTASSFVVSAGANDVVGSIAVNGATAEFTPAAPLFDNTTYTVTVSTAVKDLAGNALPSAFSADFTTVAGTPQPTVSGGEVSGGGGCAMAPGSGSAGSLREAAGSYGLLVLVALGMALGGRVTRREK
ncbi:MAG TPA: Ig-like domain-containing protein [Anaerolineales bacterium]